MAIHEKKEAKYSSKWAAGLPAYGFWSYLTDPLAQEIMGALQPDYVLNDLQHGEADFSSLASAIRAANISGTDPIVRVPGCDPEIIGKVLDFGVLGVMLPMVEMVSTVEEFIASVSFPPHGRRSYGPIRSDVLYGKKTLTELA